MKLTKYIAAFLLFAFCMVFYILIGTSDFQMGDYSMQVTEPSEIDSNIIAEVARQNHVLVYTYTSTQTSLYEETITYYTAEDMADTLWNERLRLSPTSLQHPISGTITLSSATFAQLEENEEIKEYASMWYLVGDIEDCKAALITLKRTYEYDIKGSEMSQTLGQKIPYFMLGFVFLLLLFYSYIDSSYTKKEIAIRSTLGESLLRHYLKFCILDTIVFSGLFGICYYLQTLYTQLPKHYTKAYFLLVPFLALNWFVNLHLLKIKPKEILYGHKMSDHLLLLLKGLGNIAAIFSCVGILYASTLLPSTTEYKQAQALFDSTEEYSLIDVNYNLSDNFEEASEQFRLQRLLYAQDLSTLNPITIYDLRVDLSDVSWEGIYCNYNALDYLKSVIPECESVNLSIYDMVILLPTNAQNSLDSMREELTDCFTSYEGYSPETSKILYINYTPNSEIIAFSTEYDSGFTYYSAPAICIASNTLARDDVAFSALNYSRLSGGTLYQVTDSSVVEAYCENYGFHAVITNMYEKFQMDYQRQILLTIVSILTIALLLAFYFMITRMILRLEYQINAKELSIKKILGYSILSKNRNLFIGAMITILCNIFATYFFIKIMESTVPMMAIFTPLLLFVINIFLLLILIKHIEQQQLSKILKGGAL